MDIEPQQDWFDRLGNRIQPALVLAILALGFSAWQGWRMHVELDKTRDQVARQMADASHRAELAQQASRQTADNMHDLAFQLAGLEAKMAQSQSQQATLLALYHSLSVSRDAWTLSDVEQLLLTANQQLQLDGNVHAALIALQDADTRLAALDRPQFVDLRRALAADMNRLRTTPQPDTVGMALELDALLGTVAKLPLNSERTRTPLAVKPAKPENLLQAWWQPVRELLQIHRIDKQEQALLLPEQAYFLRQNLSLRLLSARVALTAHDESGFHTDLKLAIGWLTTYFNLGDRATQQVLQQLNILQQEPVNVALPNLDASMAALKASHFALTE